MNGINELQEARRLTELRKRARQGGCCSLSRKRKVTKDFTDGRSAVIEGTSRVGALANKESSHGSLFRDGIAKLRVLPLIHSLFVIRPICPQARSHCLSKDTVVEGILLKVGSFVGSLFNE